jgi:Arc/MetJ family transcription regulator
MNIELDDDLLAEAAKYSTSRSKRRLVHEALAMFVAVKAEERRRATYKERLERARGRLAWYLQEEFSPAARAWQERLLGGQVRLLVPSLHCWQFGRSAARC